MICIGEEYRDSMRDNPEIYINGEGYKDVNMHPQLNPRVDKALLPVDSKLRCS